MANNPITMNERREMETRISTRVKARAARAGSLVSTQVEKCPIAEHSSLSS
jgi:hypothetical protein